MVRLLLAVLATYRLARLLSLEEGPAGVLDKVRARAGAYDYGEDGLPETNLGRGVSCPLCVGVWVAMEMAALWQRPTKTGDWILSWLGIAGGQAVIHGLLTR